MQRGNILVIGNSGVGKSTLINSILGEEIAEVGWGTEGTTKELSIFESEKIPFRVIDTVGFEPTFFKSHNAINSVKKWSKDSAKVGKEDTQINIIWFCVDGTSAKLFDKTIKDLSKATSIWKTVPVIAVITKSYSVPDRTKNIEMINNAFAKQNQYSKNLRKVIPVVASTFVLNDTAYAAPEGISELIDATNELMPEGLKAGETDISTFKLNRKRAMAHGITGASTTGAVIVGAVPIPFADAAILAPIELGLINGLARIYEINKDENSKLLFNSIVEVGAVGAAAKAAISALKAIPGINLAASVLNAIIAGSIVASIGEGSIYVFEQIYLGKRSVEDIDWVKKVIESKFSSRFIDVVQNVSQKVTNDTDKKSIAKIIVEVIKESFSLG
jgi:uncharacterized protein (DUF697 family)/GTPase Era involved in 16S rRNA processing